MLSTTSRMFRSHLSSRASRKSPQSSKWVSRLEQLEDRRLLATMTFGSVSSTAVSYTENGLTVTSIYAGSGDHLHIRDFIGSDGDSELLNHSSCCSQPYRFDMGVTPFTFNSVTVESHSGTSSFVASPGGATVNVTGTGTIVFPAGFSNITSVQWNQPSGNTYIDDVVFNANKPPVVASDTDPVVVFEGATANNTGTVSDPDGDTVTLSASPGSVVNNNDGTWSWSFNTSDGPAESQTVTISANDGNGGTAETTFELTVNNVAPSVDSITVPLDPVNINDQPISASATFSDPAGTNDEAYTCTVDYGDGGGALAGTVSGTTCTGPDQTYAVAGVYQVTVAVTDKDGDTGDADAGTFIVIYDPSDGFVTGGGWIDSPEGASVENPLATGKANFGFVSKYKKGATTPTGNTQFNFKAGDLNFHSDLYDWLVITMAGTNAQYKGEGTINGGLAPNGTPFKFMIWAQDNDPSGDDTFRIKIWWENGGENLVYDNGFNQALGGGKIQIHQKLVAQSTDDVDFVGSHLTQAMLDRATSDAIAYWVGQGVDAGALNDVEVQIADLNGALLGTASLEANSVWIDRDAGGFGWSSSEDDEGIDLLSTVTHELGHMIGIHHDVLGSTLSVNERHLPELNHVGDANRDGVFDQLDLVQVLQAAKYGTGEHADWSQGDWNGDGRFDQMDLVEALQREAYQSGEFEVDKVFADIA